MFDFLLLSNSFFKKIIRLSWNKVIYNIQWYLTILRQNKYLPILPQAEAVAVPSSNNESAWLEVHASPLAAATVLQKQWTVTFIWFLFPALDRMCRFFFSKWDKSSGCSLERVQSIGEGWLILIMKRGNPFQLEIRCPNLFILYGKQQKNLLTLINKDSTLAELQFMVGRRLLRNWWTAVDATLIDLTGID